MADLLPCPFCGGPARRAEASNTSAGVDMILCVSCGCRMYSGTAEAWNARQHEAVAGGIRPAKNPMPNGFDLATFAPSLDGEAGESLGAFLASYEGYPAKPISAAEIEEGTLYGSAAAIQRLRSTLEAAAGNAQDLVRLRALLAQAESSLNAIENLCALNPRLADGEVHHTAMRALAAVREGR